MKIHVLYYVPVEVVLVLPVAGAPPEPDLLHLGRDDRQVGLQIPAQSLYIIEGTILSKRS
jgi:hypothetical protein